MLFERFYVYGYSATLLMRLTLAYLYQKLLLLVTRRVLLNQRIH